MSINTNYIVNGVGDLSTLFLPLSGGTSTTATGYLYNAGTLLAPNYQDLNTLFASQTTNPGTSYIITEFKVNNYTPSWASSGTYDLGQIFKNYIPFTVTGTLGVDYTIITNTPLQSYYVYILTTGHTFTALANLNITYTLVSGGFAGAGYVSQSVGSGVYYNAGGGGGGGGVIVNNTTPTSLINGNTISCTIGNGQIFGSSPGITQNTSISGTITGSAIYSGGGGGGIGGYTTTNMTGSGGSGNTGGSQFGQSGTPAPSGYSTTTKSVPGGGGGAGATGATGVETGGGLFYSAISGAGGAGLQGVDNNYYGGGGGGGAITPYSYMGGTGAVTIFSTPGAGGTGGGGAGTLSPSANGSNGAPNKGGGGGGGSGTNSPSSSQGGNGGSGVIVFYVNT
jgi:hypothetical protein